MKEVFTCMELEVIRLRNVDIITSSPTTSSEEDETEKIPS